MSIISLAQKEEENFFLFFFFSRKVYTVAKIINIICTVLYIDFRFHAINEKKRIKMMEQVTYFLNDENNCNFWVSYAFKR